MSRRPEVTDIAERLPTAGMSGALRPDDEIARDACDMISTALGRTAEHVQPVVARGWITLEGTVQHEVDRSAVHCVARSVSGAQGVTDRVEVRRMRLSSSGAPRGLPR